MLVDAGYLLLLLRVAQSDSLLSSTVHHEAHADPTSYLFGNLPQKTHALPAGMQHVADYSGEVRDGEGRQLQNRLEMEIAGLKHWGNMLAAWSGPARQTSLETRGALCLESIVMFWRWGRLMQGRCTSVHDVIVHLPEEFFSKQKMQTYCSRITRTSMNRWCISTPAVKRVSPGLSSTPLPSVCPSITCAKWGGRVTR